MASDLIPRTNRASELPAILLFFGFYGKQLDVDLGLVARRDFAARCETRFRPQRVAQRAADARWRAGDARDDPQRFAGGFADRLLRLVAPSLGRTVRVMQSKRKHRRTNEQEGTHFERGRRRRENEAHLSSGRGEHRFAT